jgi:hypothetical protein
MKCVNTYIELLFLLGTVAHETWLAEWNSHDARRSEKRKTNLRIIVKTGMIL